MYLYNNYQFNKLSSILIPSYFSVKLCSFFLQCTKASPVVFYYSKYGEKNHFHFSPWGTPPGAFCSSVQNDCFFSRLSTEYLSSDFPSLSMGTSPSECYFINFMFSSFLVCFPVLVEHIFTAS